MGATRGVQAHQEPRKASQRRRQVLEGHLRAKEAIMGPPASLPYQEMSGHHLAYRTKKPQHDKADVVRARNKDGGKQTTGSSAIRTSGGNKKQRKTTKEVDR